MLPINEISINEQAILNGGRFILVKAIPNCESQVETNDTSSRIGTKLIVALTARELKKIEVLVEDIVVCSSFNDLDLAEVVFNEFEGEITFEEETMTYGLSATAKSFKVVNRTK